MKGTFGTSFDVVRLRRTNRSYSITIPAHLVRDCEWIPGQLMFIRRVGEDNIKIEPIKRKEN